MIIFMLAFFSEVLEIHCAKLTLEKSLAEAAIAVAVSCIRVVEVVVVFTKVGLKLITLEIMEEIVKSVSNPLLSSLTVLNRILQLWHLVASGANSLA